MLSTSDSLLIAFEYYEFATQAFPHKADYVELFQPRDLHGKSFSQGWIQPCFNPVLKFYIRAVLYEFVWILADLLSFLKLRPDMYKRTDSIKWISSEFYQKDCKEIDAQN
jgi:hypothetical protein